MHKGMQAQMRTAARSDFLSQKRSCRDDTKHGDMSSPLLDDVGLAHEVSQNMFRALRPSVLDALSNRLHVSLT